LPCELVVVVDEPKLLPTPYSLLPTPPSTIFPVERTGTAMTNSTVLIADMAILVGIFLLGLLAKLFPKKGRNSGTKN